MSATEQDRKILVAIDFGTTYSAIAWTQTLKSDVQEVVTLWPTLFSQANEGENSDKVPTELRYEENGEVKWGFQILDCQPRHQLFKLELDESKKYKTTTVSRDLPDPRGLPPGYDHSSSRLISDYLEALRKHTEHVLRSKIPAPALATTPIEYIVTVPAVWSDNAKAKTKAAAQQAGMGKVHLVAEPEAGAVYALHALHPHTIKIGDTFMSVDAGGGTVDVITYQVEQLQPILKISEVTSGAGALCGSAFLNRRFQEDLKRRFSGNRYWDDDVLEEATERFERVVKRTFTGIGNEEFNVPVGGLRDDQRAGIRRSKLRVTGAEVEAFFEPIVQEILTLVQEQMDAIGHPVSTILLIGGFGQSHYLRSKLQAKFATTTVMRSPQSWTAVVRGALMMGLASTSPNHPGVRISARKARKHYGIYAYEKFNPMIHDDSRKWWCKYEGAHQIDTMTWFIAKNDTVREQKPQRRSYWQAFKVSKGKPKSVACSIFSCTDGDSRGAPLYATGKRELFNVWSVAETNDKS